MLGFHNRVQELLEQLGVHISGVKLNGFVGEQSALSDSAGRPEWRQLEGLHNYWAEFDSTLSGCASYPHIASPKRPTLRLDSLKRCSTVFGNHLKLQLEVEQH